MNLLANDSGIKATENRACQPPPTKADEKHNSCDIERPKNRRQDVSIKMSHAAWHGMTPNNQAQRPPPETPGRLQESLTNYPNGPTAKRGGGSLQRSG
jgi:hypothetical protein